MVLLSEALIFAAPKIHNNAFAAGAQPRTLLEELP